MSSNWEEDRKRAEFADRVRVRLAALKWTQADLARKAGMTPQAMSQTIHRGPYVTYATLERLAALLEVTVAWLTDGALREAIPQPEQPILGPLDHGGNT